MIATVETCPTTATTSCTNQTYQGKLSYQHTDNLGSGNVETNQSGQVTELTDSYAFGEVRTKQFQTNTLQDQRSYTGHELDSNGLTYANQRYLNTKTGSFISEDIVCRNLSQDFLQDPQLLNCYSYGLNNPFKYTDPTGEYVTVLIELGFTGWDAYDVYSVNKDPNATQDQKDQAAFFAVLGVYLPFGGYRHGYNKGKDLVEFGSKKIDNIESGYRAWKRSRAFRESMEQLIKSPNKTELVEGTIDDARRVIKDLDLKQVKPKTTPNGRPETDWYETYISKDGKTKYNLRNYSSSEAWGGFKKIDATIDIMPQSTTGNNLPKKEFKFGIK
jgi:RHS repeat-associated protein